MYFSVLKVKLRHLTLLIYNIFSSLTLNKLGNLWYFGFQKSKNMMTVSQIQNTF